MYSLSSEDYFTKSITENTSPPYTLPLNDFGETNDQLADQITTLSGQVLGFVLALTGSIGSAALL